MTPAQTQAIQQDAEREAIRVAEWLEHGLLPHQWLDLNAIREAARLLRFFAQANTKAEHDA